MTLLADEARAALAAKQAAEAAAAQEARRAFRQSALAALRGVLSTATAEALAALQVESTDMAARMVVVSDGEVHLGLHQRDGGAWAVRVVRMVDDGWSVVPDIERVDDLVELAAALDPT